MGKKAGSFIKGLLTGGLVGAAIGLLYAPFSGKETQEMVKEKIDMLKNDNESFLGEFLGRIKEAVVEGQKAAQEKAREIEEEGK